MGRFLLKEKSSLIRDPCIKEVKAKSVVESVNLFLIKTSLIR